LSDDRLASGWFLLDPGGTALLAANGVPCVSKRSHVTASRTSQDSDKISQRPGSGILTLNQINIRGIALTFLISDHLARPGVAGSPGAGPNLFGVVRVTNAQRGQPNYVSMVSGVLFASTTGVHDAPQFQLLLRCSGG
jgi:hypothetical protein